MDFNHKEHKEKPQRTQREKIHREHKEGHGAEPHPLFVKFVEASILHKNNA